MPVTCTPISSRSNRKEIVAKSKSKAKNKKPVTEAPKRIAAKGGLTSTQLVNETLILMEDETRISKKAGRDFMESMVAAIENALAAGQPVNIGGLVKLVPNYHTKGVRDVREEFGNPESALVQKKYPAKVSLKATVMKRAKEALPTVAKMQKALGV